MVPWWLAATIALSCLTAGLTAGIILAGGGQLIADDPDDQTEFGGDDTDPGYRPIRQFPMH